jgi:predicted dehydrogenase
MLDELADALDAVIIATPHHSQAAISAAAIRRGKHVYCEKPIAQDVGEARDLRQLVGQHVVVTQMGNQGLASDSYRHILELVQDGALGEIREAHQWFISDYRRDPRDDEVPPADPTRVPDGLDWDLYLGPAAERPYHHEYMRWARWRDFGTGMLGMGGSHSCHMAFNALGLRALWESNDGAAATIRVEAEFSPAQTVIGPDDALFPEWEIVRFDIPARGSLPPARINWYKGRRADLARMGILQRLEKQAGRSLDWGSGWASESGTLVVGTNGMVHTNMHNSECALLPLEKFPQQNGPPQRIPRAGSHEREWVNACRGRGPNPISSFDYAAPVLELLLLGNICTLLKRPVEFDPMACKIVGDDEANAALRPPRRDGWPV